MVKASLLILSCSTGLSAGELSVLVVGDSFGDTGPTYKALDDTFKKNSVPATTKSTAVGGTTTCHWSSQQSGMKLVNDAKKKFPNAADGPDYMWYTLGANDQWSDSDFQSCLKNAKHGTWQDALDCAAPEVERLVGCGATMLENYWAEFPKSKVLFTGYDIPCYSALCDLSFTHAFYGALCDNNKTCDNSYGQQVQKLLSDSYVERFKGKPFTAVSFMGAAQKAAGVPGADVGVPVLDQGAECDYTTYCVHPKYGSPAGDAWTDAFWDKYFKDELSGSVV
jgi:hypothetical protein